jgi:beta-xylosidase
MIQWSALINGAGYLRLFAYPSDTGKNLWTVPNLLLQKIPAPAFTVTTKINFTVDKDACTGKKAGLIVMGTDYGYISVNRNTAGYNIRQVICKNAEQHQEEEIAAEAPLSAGAAFLRVTVTAPDALCQFSYSEDGITYKNLGKTVEAKPGRWIGAKIGLFCTATPATKNSGYADFDWFRITK